MITFLVNSWGLPHTVIDVAVLTDSYFVVKCLSIEMMRDVGRMVNGCGGGAIMSDLADDQPLELAMRPQSYRSENFLGACWFGLRDCGPSHAGACRKSPAEGSTLGLCDEHLDLFRQWSDGATVPDPRSPHWRNGPEHTEAFPDMYLNGVLIDAETA